MTREELKDIIGYSNISALTPYIAMAREIKPELFGEDKKSSMTVYNFNRDEIEVILSQIPTINEIERELILEEVKPGKRYIVLSDPYIPGTQKFIRKYQNNKYKYEVCSCCTYLMKKSWNGGKTARLYPFCRFYSRFIMHMKVQDDDGTLRKADIFKDKCDTFTRGELVLFTKE